MSEDAQVTEKPLEASTHRNSPKHSQAKWMEVKAKYESGDWKSLREIGRLYGIDHRTLQSKITREGWDKQRAAIISRIESKVEERTVSRLEGYLSRLNLRGEKYEKMLDASISQQSTTNDGVPLCDVDQLDTLTRAELRIVELQKVALRIPAIQATDITSKGLSVGESIVSAIAKLRESGKAIKVTDEQVDRILEMEVVREPRH